MDLETLRSKKLYYNPGCALLTYRTLVPGKILEMLRKHLGDVEFIDRCCRVEKELEKDSVVITNCPGCWNRYNNEYEGVSSVYLPQIVDLLDGEDLPDYTGLEVSIQDSCKFRNKPEVHDAIRSILTKMGVKVTEAENCRENSVCCGNSLYRKIPDEEFNEEIEKRAQKMPCDDVVTYCIGCTRTVMQGGKTPRYLYDLITGCEPEPIEKDIRAFRKKLKEYKLENRL